MILNYKCYKKKKKKKRKYKVKMAQSTKGHKYFSEFILLTSSLLIKFQGCSFNSILRCFADKEKNAKIYKGPLLMIYFSKFIQK